MNTQHTVKRIVVALGLVMVAMVVLAACGAGTQATPETPDRLQVTVSIVPQQYFVDRIGGDHVATSVMVEPGASPATYEPKPEQLKALSNSAAYFTIGVPFEDAWLDRIAGANPDMEMVDTIAEIERMPISAHEHDHEHEEEAGAEAEDDHDHEEGAPDPHVWVSPALVQIQAQSIAEALIALDPEHESDYRANLDAFLADIDALEADLRETLAGVTNRKFLVFHPSWGYFARDFGLEQIAIEVGGQEPSARELAALIAEAQEENIKVVFAQPEFSTADAETIAQEIGGEVLLISPLAHDWLANMREVAAVFAEALGR